MMRAEMSPDMERIMKTCNGNNDVRLACEKNPDCKESYKKSVLPPKELLESVFLRLSLKDKPFRIVEAAEEEEIGRFIESQLDKIDKDLASVKTHEEIKKIPSIQKFFDTHATKRTYFSYVNAPIINLNFMEKLEALKKLRFFPILNRMKKMVCNIIAQEVTQMRSFFHQSCTMQRRDHTTSHFRPPRRPPKT